MIAVVSFCSFCTAQNKWGSAYDYFVRALLLNNWKCETNPQTYKLGTVVRSPESYFSTIRSLSPAPVSCREYSLIYVVLGDKP